MRSAVFAPVVCLLGASMAFGQGQSITAYQSYKYQPATPWETAPGGDFGNPITTAPNFAPFGQTVAPAATAPGLPASADVSPSAFTMNFPGDAAQLRVVLPAGGEVQFGDSTVQQPSRVREYVSPGLSPDREYSYRIRARWNENGQDVSQERTVTFRAGDRRTVDFTRDRR